MQYPCGSDWDCIGDFWQPIERKNQRTLEEEVRQRFVRHSDRLEILRTYLQHITILFKYCTICISALNKNYPKLCGNSKNCPAAKDSAPETEVISFLSWLFSINPGRSVDSVCVMTGLARVGLVSLITETK